MPATLVPTLSPTPRFFVTIPLTTPTAFSKDSPHSSWTNPCSEMDDDVENWEMYKPGGLHPVVLGDVFHDRYTVVHKLGQGGFATVWLVWDRIHNQYVALKIMRADHSENCQELKILQYLSKLDIDLAENFICPFLDQFWLQGPNGSHVCLVFPLAGQRVSDEIVASGLYTNEKRIFPARYFGRQLAHAVAFLHSLGIIHGDLTRSNILTQVGALPTYSLDDLYDRIGHPRRVLSSRWGSERRFEYLVEPADLSPLPTNKTIFLIDFGEAFFIDRPPSDGSGIPARYDTPEGIFSKCVSPGSDIWAIGCLLYEWWCNEQLFEGEDLEEMAYAWTQAFGKLPPLYWPRYFGRENYFDECGKFIDPKKVHYDLKNRMKQMWDLFSKYFGTSQKVPADRITQICDSVLSSFSHDLPKMGFSIVEDQTQRQLVITPELHNQTKARSLGLPSMASHHSKSGSATFKRVEQLTFHSSHMGSPHVTINGSKVCPEGSEAASESLSQESSPTENNQSAAGEQPTSISVHGPSKEHPIAPKPPNHSTQLPPSITDLYTLLLQLFNYEPSKRLPALLISRHPWFGDATLVGDESREFESAENEEESEGLKMGLRTQNSMDKAVGSSKKGEVAMWSVVLDMELGTWKYVRSVEVGRASGGHKAD